MESAGARVFVVDDDPSVRKSLGRLLESSGYVTEMFASAQKFLQREPYDGPACLVLDVNLPDLNGLAAQQALAARDCPPAIVFITGFGDIPMSVHAMKGGAVDFLSKPYSDKALLKAIEQALAKNHQERNGHEQVSLIKKRLSTLTRRQYEVLGHVVAGKLNKVIAADLGISIRTVKVHRGIIMRKMEVESLAELVRMANQVGIRGERQPQQANKDQEPSSSQ